MYLYVARHLLVIPPSPKRFRFVSAVTVVRFAGCRVVYFGLPDILAGDLTVHITT